MKMRVELCLKGLVAAAISGGTGGILSVFAAVGIDPQDFNLRAGSVRRCALASPRPCKNCRCKKRPAKKEDSHDGRPQKLGVYWTRLSSNLSCEIEPI